MANEYMARNEEIVDGVYPLGALIWRSVAGGEIYETEFGADGNVVPAVIKIREVESGESEILSRRLRNAARLAHPGLLKIYASGSSALDGVSVFYVVMERAQESLKAVLTERALTNSETREMLVPALEVLSYLHKNGYAHSRLQPSNVLAVNDQLKLSVDSVIQVTDGEAAEDMRALGVLIVQALTQKIPNADGHWGLQNFDEIPQPLADIVRHCLDPDRTRRWTAEQVKAALNPPAIVVPELPRLAEEPDAGDARPGMPKWVYAGLAALILAVVLVAVTRNHDPAPVASPLAAVPQHDLQIPAADPPVAEPRPVTPAPHTEAPPAAALRPANPLGERKTSGWSVIVGAYRSRELAEKRMREMAKRWPKFEISVLESKGEKASYLLVLGRNLSEDQAEALRSRAIKSRLPRDTYIKRLR